MMRPNGVEKQVRPPFKPRTFTISWTEQSNMSSGWTYSDDAAGLTAGSTAFDEFFGYSAVKLSTAGVETAEVTQASSGGAGKLKITDLGTLTGGDNVMIKFPVRGIKMSKSGSTVTLSITDELNKDGYQYYAHTTSGTLDNPSTPKNAFYLGVYEASNNGSNVLKSWSGQSPEGGQTQATFCTRAKANGTGYNIYGYYQRMYITALYMMKYGNPDAQSVVGMGYVGGSAKTNTGGTNSQTNATYGTTSSTVQCKIFGLEDRWGNMNEWVGGAMSSSSKQLITSFSGWSGTATESDYPLKTGTTIRHNSSYTCLSSIAGNNKAMFGPTYTANNSNYNTYYGDYVYVLSSKIAAVVGNYASGKQAGIFSLDVGDTASDAYNWYGSRLLYL